MSFANPVSEGRQVIAQLVVSEWREDVGQESTPKECEPRADCEGGRERVVPGKPSDPAQAPRKLWPAELEKSPASDRQARHGEEQGQQCDRGSVQPMQEPACHEQCDLDLAQENRRERKDLLERAVQV